MVDDKNNSNNNNHHKSKESRRTSQETQKSTPSQESLEAKMGSFEVSDHKDNLRSEMAQDPAGALAAVFSFLER